MVNGENNEGGILEKLGDDAQELKIGHSYFLKLIPEDKESEPSFSDLKNIWFYSIIPLLEEYCGFNKSMLSGLFTNKVKVDLSKKEIFILENLIGI